MYPHTFYEVLAPSYSETGAYTIKTDPDTGRTYQLRWQQVEWTVVGVVESMEEARMHYGGCPILRAVGFRPRELCAAEAA